ncbi:hypothetical protein HDU76_001009 [Blyttiomyces sp. JEL0837]|nr:hypothetical protein HDU76_001009 [Blyttiomyces sp. JEL0837]
MQKILTNVYYQNAVAMSVKTTAISVIYQKTMMMSAAAKLNYPNGKIMNLISSDCSNLEDFFTYILDGIFMPLEIIGLVIMMIIFLGPAGAIGVAFMLIFVGLNSLLTTTSIRFQTQALEATDARVKLTSEVLTGIKIVKFFAWENALSDRIQKLREKELLPQLKLRIVGASFTGMIDLLPTCVMVIIFGSYYGLGNQLTPAVVFTGISIVNLLRIPVAIFPLVLQLCWSSLVSLRRIGAFLAVDELDSPPSLHDPSENATEALVISNASFVWPEGRAVEDGESVEGATKNDKKNGKEKKKIEEDIVLSEKENDGKVDDVEPKLHLTNINLSIKRGTLTVIVGRVGVGKSSLLNAIIGDMSRTSGSVDIYGTVGLSPQTAWLQNATLRNNVLFGNDYDEEKYQTVIKACALTRDLSLLPDGDMSEIGEKGVNLSGGQSARVNLARTIYADPDLILLDDPLAAVDSHVGRSILENCILGLCKSKTVVLVTHQLHIASHADLVVLMEDGMIVEQGSFDTLMKNGKAFATMMAEYGGDHGNDGDDDDKEKDVKVDEKKKPTEESKEVEHIAQKDSTTALVIAEERQEGVVSWEYYRVYFEMAGGVLLIFSLVVFAAVYQGERVFTDLWLTFWVNEKFPGWSNNAYIVGLLSLALLQALLLTANAVFFAVASIRASRSIHQKTIKSVMRAPMSFFETNPMGRIISRFSKDFTELDIYLPRVMKNVLEIVLSILETFALVGYAVPYVLIFAVFLVPVYQHFLKIFRASMRELKRVEAIARSPLYSQINETFTGLSTIRAYRAEGKFIKTQHELQNIANQPTYIKNCVDSWMSIRAEAFIAVLIALIATLGLATHVNPSFLGLALSYSLTLTAYFNISLRSFAELEAKMNSVERLSHYCNNLPQEAAGTVAEGAKTSPPPGWPQQGSLQFNKLTLKYRPELDPVLHELSFEINAGEKVGVVGRTGAGKSSIITALFRLVEPSSGTVIIDGVDIRDLGVYDLRGRLSIIPQAPILFDGTIRSNLDPTGVHPDASLWNVLERCALKDFVSTQEGKLSASVTEGGDNLSVGQRQLLCLGRAMLVQSKVLLIDEATASVDMETDSYIQKILREDFADCTVICIAHRLNTLIDYDKILVLDHGRIVEYDSPATLLERADSAFGSFVDETGPTNAALLRKLALESRSSKSKTA